jgi:hypothetical protein
MVVVVVVAREIGGRTRTDFFFSFGSLGLSREGGNGTGRETEEEDDLTLKCIAPIRVRDFGRVESQLLFSFFLLFSFSFLLVNFFYLIFFSYVLFELLPFEAGGRRKSSIKLGAG